MALDLEWIGRIPSMGGDKAAQQLYLAACRAAEGAADRGGGGAAVECGAWLGAGTAAIAMGLRDYDLLALEEGRPRCGMELAVFDKWTATASEVEKAAALGWSLERGQDLRPWFLHNVAGIYPNLRTTKADTQVATWDPATPIYLYVDDCNKRPTAWDHAMVTFRPAFVPGETTLFLMDYDYYTKFSGGLRLALRCQADYIEANASAFQCLGPVHGTTGRVFLYRG